MDVLYSTSSVSPQLHRQLCAQLDALASKGGTQPMPQYHTLIDPNLAAVDGLWVPTEFDIEQAAHVPAEIAALIELSCLAATGERLPFGFAHLIARLATDGGTRAECALRSPIPGLKPHEHVKLHVATQGLMRAAVPMLASLRRPALLLPGPVQAVVKAQRIVVEEGADYAGVWHEDGMDEHVVAVVLYYYRASPTLVGGALEFCSKQTHALWCGDAGGEHGTLENASRLASSLPRCQVPISQGTLVVFSNYAAVHRVLRMEAAGGRGSREFVAFFIIDQRHPLPTPRRLPPLAERRATSQSLLEQQLQPRGTFGYDSTSVYSTGNGSVADVGWVRHGAAHSTHVEEANPDAASLIQRLNLSPPQIGRGASMLLQGPRLRTNEAVAYNSESGWAEVWIGAEPSASSCLYVDRTWSCTIREEPPEDGVSEVLCFSHGMVEFAAFVEERGYWCDDERLAARLAGTAIELIVAGESSWVLRTQLEPIRRLRGLAEGSRCELVPFLTEFVAGLADDGEGSEPFNEGAWPDCLAFILDPDATLRPLEQARGMTYYFVGTQKRMLLSELFNIKVNACWLGYRALEKAANAAMGEVDAMAIGRR